MAVLGRSPQASPTGTSRPDRALTARSASAPAGPSLSRRSRSLPEGRPRYAAAVTRSSSRGAPDDRSAMVRSACRPPDGGEMPPLATGPLQPEEADLMRGPSTPLSEVIESFLLAQVNLSPRTLDGYAQNLRAFDRWLGGGRVRDLHPDAVNAYVLERKATSPHGARYSAATIKAFASWLAQRGYLVASGGGSALATVRIPRVPKGGRTAYSDADLALIFRTIERQSHRTRARDRALVMFLLGTGLRLNEARELDISDVHIERPVEKSHILVRAAPSKSR